MLSESLFCCYDDCHGAKFKLFSLFRLTLRQLDFEVKVYDDLAFRDMVKTIIGHLFHLKLGMFQLVNSSFVGRNEGKSAASFCHLGPML
jgi:hypothetical protein